MSERDRKLRHAWLGDVYLGERKLNPLSFGRIQKLESLGNKFFSNDELQSDMQAMIEIIFVMYSTPDEIKDHCRKTYEERSTALSDFALDHEEDFETAIETVTNAVAAVAAAQMESTEGGKVIRHA